MYKAHLKNLAFDLLTQSIVVLLESEDSQKYLPIWIGNNEAVAIAYGLKNISAQRPMTHDLLASIINGLGGNLQKIVITGLKDSTYFAMLHINQNNTNIVIDARPSDSLAIASRIETDLFIAESVELIDPSDSPEHERLSERLKIIDPNDLISL